MERYAPIHPERPLRRVAVAMAVSLAVHVALGALLYALAVAAAAALLRAQSAQPKAVTLSDLDPTRWEANRHVEGEPPPPVPVPRRTLQEVRTAPERAPERSAVAMIAPSSGEGARRPESRASDVPAAAPRGAAATSPAPTGPALAAEGMEPGPAAGTLDLSPRPQTIRPLAMRFDPVGTGQRPVDEGTSFGGLTVQTPEAWRFTNFFGRAVEAMNSVYRYEMGAPVPVELQTLILSRRALERCSFTFVRIDASGRVVDVSVRRTSGIAELDALIVEVIKRTAPFVNVPGELTGAGGVYADTWGLCIGVRR